MLFILFITSKILVLNLLGYNKKDLDTMIKVFFIAYYLLNYFSSTVAPFSIFA